MEKLLDTTTTMKITWTDCYCEEHTDLVIMPIGSTVMDAIQIIKSKKDCLNVTKTEKMKIEDIFIAY